MMACLTTGIGVLMVLHPLVTGHWGHDNYHLARISVSPPFIGSTTCMVAYDCSFVDDK